MVDVSLMELSFSKVTGISRSATLLKNEPNHNYLSGVLLLFQEYF